MQALHRLVAVWGLLSLSACSLVSSTPSPGATASSTPGASHTPAPLATTAPPGTPLEVPAAGPTPAPTSSPTPSGWELESIAAVGRVAAGLGDHVALAIDPAGNAHIAAAGAAGVFYLTNATGEWVQQRISVLPQSSARDTGPAIAVDQDGAVAIAFTRATCGPVGCGGIAIHLALKTTGDWSEPIPVATGSTPSIALRDGFLHIAYIAVQIFGDEACGRRNPIHYLTGSIGESLVDQRVARHGDRPVVQLDSNDRPVVLVGNYSCEFLGPEGIFVATRAGGAAEFDLEAIPGTTSEGNRAADMSVDSQGGVHVLFWTFDEEGDETHSVHIVRTESGWGQQHLIAAIGTGVALAAGPDQVAHVIGLGPDGTVYATNDSGTFATRQISPTRTYTHHGAAMAIDSAGQPHAVWVVADEEGRSPELWYGIGPAT